jgi:hypothetical protein
MLRRMTGRLDGCGGRRCASSRRHWPSNLTSCCRDSGPTVSRTSGQDAAPSDALAGDESSSSCLSVCTVTRTHTSDESSFSCLSVCTGTRSHPSDESSFSCLSLCTVTRTHTSRHRMVFASSLDMLACVLPCRGRCVSGDED